MSKNVICLMRSLDEDETKREYVIGKARHLYEIKEDIRYSNLDDMKVIFYVSCESYRIMEMLEVILLAKLGEFRCKFGRFVFNLPKPTDFVKFKDIFKECVEFYDVKPEYVEYPMP